MEFAFIKSLQKRRGFFSFQNSLLITQPLVLATTNENSLAIFNDVWVLKINFKNLKYMFEAGTVWRQFLRSLPILFRIFSAKEKQSVHLVYAFTSQTPIAVCNELTLSAAGSLCDAYRFFFNLLSKFQI